MLSLLLTLVTNAICVWRHNLQRHDLTGTHNVDNVRVLVARPSPTTHSPHPKKGCWGMPLLENEKVYRFLGFLVFGFAVSKFLGFVVSCFQSFLVSWFHNFKDSMIPYYQISIPCFQEDIDPIFEIFKADLHDCSAPRSQHFQHIRKPFSYL